MTDGTKFDPAQHMSKVKGKDYLEVKWRIVWFRSEWPRGRVDTTILQLTPDIAAVKAEVVQVDDDGVVYGSATGMGLVERSGFEAYLEKAETKATGRALALLGFGAQFTEPGDMDYANTNGVQGSPPARDRPVGQGTVYLVTPPQQSRIKRLAGDLNMNDAALDDLARQHTGQTLQGMTKRQASGLIDMLEARRNGQSGDPQSHNLPPQRDPAENKGGITPQQKREISSLQARLGWSDDKLIGFVKLPIDGLPQGGASQLIDDLQEILAEGERG